MLNIEAILDMCVRDFILTYASYTKEYSDEEIFDFATDDIYEDGWCSNNEDKKNLFCGSGCAHKFSEDVDDISECYCEYHRDLTIAELKSDTVLNMTVRDFYMYLGNYSEEDILELIDTLQAD